MDKHTQDQLTMQILQEMYDKLGERLTEARTTLKDLHNARKEIEESYRDAVNNIAGAHRKALKEVMPSYMEDLKKAVDKACGIATERVYKRFDTLAAILMGEDGRKEPLTEVVRRWRASHDEHGRLQHD